MMSHNLGATLLASLFLLRCLKKDAMVNPTIIIGVRWKSAGCPTETSRSYWSADECRCRSVEKRRIVDARRTQCAWVIARAMDEGRESGA